MSRCNITPCLFPGNYTYAVPPEMEATIQPGSRVAVQLGQQKKYTGVVKSVHEQAPSAYKTKADHGPAGQRAGGVPHAAGLLGMDRAILHVQRRRCAQCRPSAHLKLSSETILLY